MKINFKAVLVLLGSVFFSSQVLGGIILSSSCDASHVTAAGTGADACEGLLDKNRGPAPNASESFLNNALLLEDASVVWGSEGAFGANDWVSLGKDEQSSFSFINATSGDPAEWIVDSALSGAYVISVKQSTMLGLWYFGDLQEVFSGTFDVNAIFGSGTTDDGWSNIAIFRSASSSVPEPSSIALLLISMAGLLFARKSKSI